MLVSGGVDSTVCSALLGHALPPEQVIALHVDNGFMRHEESEKVVESLQKLGLDVRGERIVSVTVLGCPFKIRHP